MAITVISQPDTIAPVKNPMVLKLSTDNQWSAASNVSYVQWVITASPNADDTITIEWGLNSYTWTFKTSPSACMDLPTYNAGVHTSYENWLDNYIFPRMRKVYLINTTFSMSRGTTGLYIYFRLTSRKIDDFADLTHASSNVDRIIAGASDANGPGTKRENFKIYCDVWAESSYGSGSFSIIAQLEADPDSAGVCEFRLDRVLRKFNSNLPQSSNTSTTHHETLRRYYYVYGEKYGSPVEVYCSNEIPSTYKTALNGGLSHIRFPDYGGLYTNLLNAATNKFLTTMPRTMEVNANMPMWLYWYVHHSTTATVKCKVYWIDGTAATTYTLQTYTGYEGKVVAFKAGYAQNSGVLTAAASLVSKYEIWIEFASSARKSETITYVMSEIDFEFNRYLIYKNSLGGYDTMWCHAASEAQEKIDGLMANRNLPNSYTVNDRLLMDYGKTMTETVEVTTGILGRHELVNGKYMRKAITDLLLSDNAYEYVGGKLYPIKIDTKKKSNGRDDENMNEIELTYTYAFESESFTPDYL